MEKIEQYVIDTVIKLRKENRLSQKQIAAILKVSPAFVGNIECPGNLAKYNLKHISILAKYFNISPHFLSQMRLIEQ